MRRKSAFVVLGLIVIVLLSAACGNNDEPTPAAAASSGSAQEAPAGGGTSVRTAGSSAAGGVAQPATRNSEVSGGLAPSGQAGASSVPYLQAVSPQTSISVTGEGTVTLEPDLAVINIGVETEARTVTAARDQAATAMAAVVAAVKARGLADRDIQTLSFNVFPRYDFLERRQRVLVGFTVSNSASIKVRDLDNVGEIIDAVADAGGDATRINGVSFTVEDPTPFAAQLREAAVQNALEKAQHYAGLTGVSLGGLVYLTEAGGVSPPRPVARGDFAVAEAASVPTSFSGGELQLRLIVQVVFGIQ